MKFRNDRSRALGSSSRPGETNFPPYDGRVVAALEEYVELLRDGWRPDRAEFLARHHSIDHILKDRLDDLDFVQGAISHLAATGPHGVATMDSAAPERLGEYRIIREIGRGGMGVVYEAEQLPLGRHVALKVLPTTASLDPRQCERFQVEAHAAGLLHHEHIVPVFGIGRDQGIHFYAMQFIVGRSLTEVIQSLRPAPSSVERAKPKISDHDPTFEVGLTHPAAACPTGSSLNNRQHCQRVAQLGLQAALALEHAHEIGVIHRDIKPSNLLIDDRDHLWVADFGLARLPHDDHDLTRTGDLVGTLRYMSPEQVRGERGMVDARTDIYALGVTLYELLTLRPAFSASDRHQLLGQILDDEPVKPRRFNSSIPRDLETIVMKAMEKEPSARYDSAQAMADDLKRLLAHQPIHARRPSFIDQSVKWARRHRAAVVASIVAMFVTLTASTAVLWATNRRLESDEVETRVQVIATLDAYAGLLNLPDDAADADESVPRSLAVADGSTSDEVADAHSFRTGLVKPFNNLAWELVRRRALAHADDIGLAVRLARKAVDWDPDQPAYWNTLGVAQYRAGDFAAADRSLQKSIRLSEGGSAVDWFFLACIKHHQGDSEESRRWYDQAVEWLRQNPVHNKDEAAELVAFRAEAAELLGSTITTAMRGETVMGDLPLSIHLTVPRESRALSPPSDGDPVLTRAVADDQGEGLLPNGEHNPDAEAFIRNEDEATVVPDDYRHEIDVLPLPCRS
jgi:serine/threonine protein kinase